MEKLATYTDVTPAQDLVIDVVARVAEKFDKNPQMTKVDTDPVNNTATNLGGRGQNGWSNTTKYLPVHKDAPDKMYKGANYVNQARNLQELVESLTEMASHAVNFHANELNVNVCEIPGTQVRGITTTIVEKFGVKIWLMETVVGQMIENDDNNDLIMVNPQEDPLTNSTREKMGHDVVMIDSFGDVKTFQVKTNSSSKAKKEADHLVKVDLNWQTGKVKIEVMK